jgi:hypothetical protein
MINRIVAFFRRSHTIVQSSDSSSKSQEKTHLNKPKLGLTWPQRLGATVLLVAWLSLFAGGITMDTAKYRCAISKEGASRLAEEARPGAEADVCKDEYETWQPVGAEGIPNAGLKDTYRLAVAWVTVLLFFLPLNLAMVAAIAGALGAVGNEANLDADSVESKRKDGKSEPDPSAETRTQSHDYSSPIMSGLLRGIFVYLFFISGMLLFDDKPFSTPGPGQYIRLAGFISLISFLVNYRPDLFNTILDWALARLLSRQEQAPQRQERVEVGVVAAGAVVTPTPPPSNGNGERPAPPAVDENPLGALNEGLKPAGAK